MPAPSAQPGPCVGMMVPSLLPAAQGRFDCSLQGVLGGRGLPLGRVEAQQADRHRLLELEQGKVPHPCELGLPDLLPL
eukprot:2282802-Pyramimonas_sp.AAC.1